MIRGPQEKGRMVTGKNPPLAEGLSRQPRAAFFFNGRGDSPEAPVAVCLFGAAPLTGTVGGGTKGQSACLKFASLVSSL